MGSNYSTITNLNYYNAKTLAYMQFERKKNLSGCLLNLSGCLLKSIWLFVYKSIKEKAISTLESIWLFIVISFSWRSFHVYIFG